MAIIPDFPANLLDLHHNWHQPGSHPGLPTRVHPFGSPGGGLEFLQFHHDFIAQFHAWYDRQPFGTAPFNVAPFDTAANAEAAVAGWTAIPAALKDDAVTNWSSVQAAQEARITRNSPPFVSDDELGTVIEGGIHGWIHGAAAAAFHEPLVGTFHSPGSTYFYGIHGLVDLWWSRWKQAPKFKDIIDSKSQIKEFDKIQKDKDIFEVGGLLGGGDSGRMLQHLDQRMTALEGQIAAGRAFIRPDERPAVGAAAQPARAAAKNKTKPR